ncbi:DMT family transporter [Nocardioides campestrisoli]|uniref:DMT family transporter n=1 Tax=Nocardioides campestrisoli TaxID=2736757 RepID=UPI001CD6B0AA|nr:DMT family transporter [Nocardioides campestrisoli]
MTAEPPATETSSPPASGLRWGLLGVLAFSFTLPLTRVAVADLPWLFIGAGRAVVAAALAAIVLVATRQRLPRGSQWARLALVGGGVVIGFPLLTSWALTSTPASHGAMVVAALPAATAVAAVLRERTRPARVFWVAAAAGGTAAAFFASAQGGSVGTLHRADLLLLLAVLVGAVGYAEGGLLARELGAWQTISWALVLWAPVMLGLTLVSVERGVPSGGAASWAAFCYLGGVSMFLGFFAWYRGLAIGPMAQVSQVQLTQPVLSIGWAALLLGEPVGVVTVTGGLVVLACTGWAVRVRAHSTPSPTDQ